jgi:hypothetical protein
MGTRRRLLIAAFAFQASALFAQSAGAVTVTLTDPVALNAGATVSSVPDDFSGTNFTGTPGFPIGYSFNFGTQGGPAGTLFEDIVQYPNPASAAHPYGSGLMFNFKIVLTSGDVTALTVDGYSGHDVSVKQCSFAGCENVSTNGAQATSASRTTDGNDITFSFSGLSASTNHTGNLQIFTDATSFVDPFGSFQDANGGVFSIDITGPLPPSPNPPPGP